jgi:hypothetical protein
MFAGQGALLATGQIILLAGVLSYPGISPLQPLGNLAAAAGYALSGAGSWILVTRLPAALIGTLRPAFLIFGIANIAWSLGLLAFTFFDIQYDYPGYSIGSSVVSLAGGVLLAAAWFCWLGTGRAATPEPVTQPATQQPEIP